MPTKPQIESSLGLETMDGPAIASGLRKSGIDVLGAVPWGTHFCQFYETPHDLIEILVPYFKEGLEQNEFCMWVTSDPLRAEDAKAALRQAVPDLEGYLRQGQLEILDYSQWYTSSGKFDADRVLRGWVEKEHCALDRGYRGLRLTGNTFWLEKSDWSNFAVYEAMVESVVKNHRMIAVCTYAVQKCNAVEVIEVVNNHQFALIKRAGRWEMMESRQRKRAEEGIAHRNAVLEGINRIFREALTCETEEQIGRLCLAVAEAVTGSKFGFIGEINPQTGLLDDIAISDPGWQVCRMHDQSGHGKAVPIGFKIHGIYGRVLLDGKGFFTNDPPSHPDSIGLPGGHAPLKAFLGTPLVHDGKTIGMVAVGNREGGYRDEELAALEGLAVAIVQVIKRRQAEEQIQQLNRELEHRVNQRTEELRVTNESLQREIAGRIKSEEELRAKSLYARSLIEASLDPLVTISPSGQITDVNNATELVTGVARDRLIGTDFSDYFTDAHKASEGYHKVLSQGFVKDYPLVIRHVSGSTTDVLYNATVFHNEAGQVQGVFAAARDITERKRTEEELAQYREHLEELVTQRTEELARSNKDLEQFAYVASHDLQEPLRAVSGFVALLQRRYRGKLDEKADGYIANAVDGAARMASLISDLLTYSRVETRGGALVPTAAQDSFDNALRNLAAGIRDTGAVITADPMPIVPADALHLTQLFQNLIGNAIKFRGDRRPEIHVGARRERDHWLFWVRDNGIGIAPEYAERIFLIFQRLHTREKYPGSGIGLAICRKIVERHGGKIWVEAQPNQGSTFYFTISDRGEHR